MAESAQGGALADAELDMVAGGKSSDGTFMVMGSVLTLGIACALTSIYMEARRGAGGCGESFQ